MSARLKNPAALIPGAVQHLQALYGEIAKGGVPEKTIHLVHLRTSQINGCSFCVDMDIQSVKKTDEKLERLLAATAWREATCFTPAERAALALADSVTRLADSNDPVPDAVWNEAARHYDERQLASLVLAISLTNLFNRVNVATRRAPGDLN